MAFASRVTYISANVSTLVYTFSFSYIDSSYVKVYFDSVLQSGVTVTTGQIALTTGAAIGVEILIQRETPTTALVDFVDGAVLTENDLDSLTVQALHVSIEAKDDSIDSIQLNALGDAYDANSKKIENIATPSASGDAARKFETDALDTRLTSSEGSITTLEGIGNGHALVTDGSNRFDAESRLIKNVQDGVSGQDGATRNQIDTLTVRRTLATNDFLADSKRIKDVADPINPQDAATKAYADSIVGGGGGIADIVEDTTPQLGGQLDVNGNAIGNGIEELIKFSETVAAVNEVTITNAATGGSPKVEASGGDADVDLVLDGKGTGVVKTLSSDLDITGNLILSGTVDGRDVAVDGTKLDTIEPSATADQTNAEIKIAYEANADTNALTDAEQVKLGFVAITQVVDLDVMESDIATNNAKVTNATHTGDVTGSTILTIANDAVTSAKIANLTIVGGDIAASTIPLSKINVISNNRVLGNVSGGVSTPVQLTAADIKTLIGYDDKLQPKAFCTFNPGATGFAEEANSFNISSITRNGAGDYTINFTNALADALYTVVCSQGDATDTPMLLGFNARTTGSVNIFVKNAGGALTDNPENISIVVNQYV